MTSPKYFAPKSIKEAISLFSELGGKAKVISGGTDLLMQMKQRELLPECMISLGDIPDLDYIQYDEIRGLKIGALTHVVNIENSPLIRSKFRILAQGASLLGTPAIRNQATIGGNLCNAAPSADMAPPLLALGAMVKIEGAAGEKIVPLENFFTGPGQTILGNNHLLTEIQVPNLLPRSGGVYLKQTRSQGADLALVGVAALVVMEGKILRDVKIALGAVAPTPIRAKRAEEILKGNELNNILLEASSQAAVNETEPIDDVRSSADYRRKLVALLTKRAVTQAVEQAEV
jgi:carbon-monoxide dehydrogenase medium subunit